jgi:spore maturation protein CgeB
LIGGALYPEGFPWTKNIYFVRHVAPGEHPAFYCSSRFTLNVTRGAMADMGYCPSGRLFEAAACGTPIISDSWEGLEQFFSPGSEILTAQGAEDVLRVLEMPEADLSKISAAARERVFAEHTAGRRALDLERELASASAPQPEEGCMASGGV